VGDPETLARLRRIISPRPERRNAGPRRLGKPPIDGQAFPAEDIGVRVGGPEERVQVGVELPLEEPPRELLRLGPDLLAGVDMKPLKPLQNDADLAVRQAAKSGPRGPLLAAFINRRRRNLSSAAA
jgi:hypothetical protein